MLKNIIIMLSLFICMTVCSQTINLDKYAYIIVANKFDFLKSADQYQTSSLTKFLLEKKGFRVYLENEHLPKEIIKKKCTALRAKVTDASSMFITKSRIEFSDCYGKVVYKSQIGKSKIKDYKKAYQEAIRNAFNTLDGFEYSYKPSLTNTEEKQKVTDVIINQQKINKTAKVTPTSLHTLYAQSIENGFQLVNTKPEVVYKVLKTNVKQLYIINGKNGIFYKIGKKWVAEFYQNNQLQQLEYDVKF